MALFTLAGLKAYLGISGTSEDTQLTLLVGMVDGLIKKYTMRDLEETEYTSELYDGPGTNALVLNQYPIIEVDTVIQGDEEVVAVTLAERESGDQGYYIKDAQNGILWNKEPWSRGRGIIEVTYTAGYYIPTGEEDEVVPTGSISRPDDLLYACYEACRYFRAIQKKAGLIHESLGRYSYTLAASLGDMGGDLTIPVVSVKNILDRYMRQEANLAY